MEHSQRVRIQAIREKAVARKSAVASPLLNPSNWLDGAERYFEIVSAVAASVEDIVSKYGYDFVTVDANGW